MIDLNNGDIREPPENRTSAISRDRLWSVVFIKRQQQLTEVGVTAFLHGLRARLAISQFTTNQIRERPLVERWAHGPSVRRRIGSVPSTVCENEHGPENPSSSVVISHRDK